MIYLYYVSRGLASLHKMHSNGNDINQKPVKIGKYSSDKEAKEACIEHHKKACKMADAAGRERPEFRFF